MWSTFPCQRPLARPCAAPAACANLCPPELETSQEMHQAKDQMLMISGDVSAEMSHSRKRSSCVAMSVNEGQTDYWLSLASKFRRVIPREGLEFALIALIRKSIKISYSYLASRLTQKLAPSKQLSPRKGFRSAGRNLMQAQVHTGPPPC